MHNSYQMWAVVDGEGEVVLSLGQDGSPSHALIHPLRQDAENSLREVNGTLRRLKIYNQKFSVKEVEVVVKP